jgi:chromosome segregation ATPase
MKRFCLKSAPLRVSYIALAWSFLLTPSWGATNPDEQYREMLEAQRKLGTHTERVVTDVVTLETLSDHDMQAFFDEGRGAEVKKAAVLKELEMHEQEEARAVEEETRLSTQLRELSKDEKASEKALLGMARSIVALKERLDAARANKEALETEAKRLRMESISKDSHLRVLGRRANFVGAERDTATREAEDLRRQAEAAAEAAEAALEAYRELSLQMKREDLAEKDARAKQDILIKERLLLEGDLEKIQASFSETNQRLFELRGEQERLVDGIKSLMQKVQSLLGVEGDDPIENGLDGFITGTRIDDFLTKAQENLQRMLLESDARMRSLEAEKYDMVGRSDRQQAEFEIQKAALIKLEEEKRAEVAKLTGVIHKLEDEVQFLKAAQAERENELAETKSKLHKVTVEKDSAERLLISIQVEKLQLEKKNQSLVEKIEALQTKQEQAEKHEVSLDRLLKAAEASLEEGRDNALRNQEKSSEKIRGLEAKIKEAQRASLGKEEEFAERIRGLETSLAEAEEEHRASLLREKKQGEERIRTLEASLEEESQKAVQAQEALVEKHKEILAAQREGHQAKLRVLEESIAEQSRLLEEKEHAIAEGLTQLEAARSQCQRSALFLKGLERALEEQKTFLMTAEEEKDRVISEASELEREREALEEKLEISDATVLRLKGELKSSAGDKVGALTRAEAARVVDRDQFDEEQKIAGELRGVITASLKDAESENRALKLKMKELDGKISTAEESLKRLSRDLAAKQKEIDSSKEIISVNHQALLKEKETVRSLEETQSCERIAEADLMKKEMTVQAALKKAYEEARKEKEALRIQMKEALTQSYHQEEIIKGARLYLVKILPSEEEESEGMSKDLERIGSLVVKLKRENRALSECIFNGQDDLVLLSEAKAKIDLALKEKEDLLVEKEKEKEDRESFLQEMLAGMKELNLEIYKQGKTIEAQEEREQSLWREIDAKEHRISSLEATVLSLRQKKESLEEDIKWLNTSLDERILENKDLERELKQTRGKLKRSRDRVLSLEEEIDEIEQDLIEQNELLMKRSRKVKKLEEGADLSQLMKEEREVLQAKMKEAQAELKAEEDRNAEIMMHVETLYPAYTKAQEDLLLAQGLLRDREAQDEVLRRSINEIERQKESAITRQGEEKDRRALAEAALVEARARNSDLVAQDRALKGMLSNLASRSGYPVDVAVSAAPREVDATPPPKYRESLDAPKSPALRLILGTPGKAGTTPNRAAVEKLMKGMSQQGRGDIYGKLLSLINSQQGDVSPGSPLRKALGTPKRRIPLSSLRGVNGPLFE